MALSNVVVISECGEGWVHWELVGLPRKEIEKRKNRDMSGKKSPEKGRFNTNKWY